MPPPEITPDILVDRVYTFEQGGRRFEVIHTPEGETLDGVTVWLPNEKVAFTGNLFGPVFLSMPFLCTIRGDSAVGAQLPKIPRQGARAWRGDPDHRPRRADPWQGQDQGRPRHAARRRLLGARLHLAGMKAGKTVHALMTDVALPPELRIGEYHGKVSWAVKTIWDEYAGWFHYEDGTTALYATPRSAVNADLVELAGGADALAARARVHAEAGRPLEALHLLDIALGVEPANRGALEVKKAALDLLLAASGGSNLSETCGSSRTRGGRKRIGKRLNGSSNLHRF